jgi:hypothetical protein
VPSADWSFYSLLHVQAANEEIAPNLLMPKGPWSLNFPSWLGLVF